MTISYEQILKDYPESMNKEQMRLVCHISKKTARLLLQTGLVPCVDTGKKTRNYRIATTDVIEYLKQRKTMPEKYILPEGSYKRGSATAISSVTPCNETHIDPLVLDEYPDVLSVPQAAALTGVVTATIAVWIRKKRLMAFSKAGAYHIPKLALIEYLSSSQYRSSPSGKRNARTISEHHI